MSNKNRNKGNKDNTPKEPKEPKEPKVRQPRSPLPPLPDRLVAKSEHALALLGDVLDILSKRGAPDHIITSTRECRDQVDNWHLNLCALKNSGWQPSERSTAKDISEGDTVAIDPERKEMYSYYPGVSDGTVDLVAGPIMIVGKSIRVLVKPRDSSQTPLGYIPRNHLIKK